MFPGLDTRQSILKSSADNVYDFVQIAMKQVQCALSPDKRPDPKRPIPDGFSIKSCWLKSILQSGWYHNISTQIMYQ
jgi:hypothetical protein